jgi:hypothetical protein
MNYWDKTWIHINNNIEQKLQQEMEQTTVVHLVGFIYCCYRRCMEP